MRAPNLGVAGEWEEPVAARAAKRKPELAAIEYITESMVDPDAYVVARFAAGVMKPPDEPPQSLSDDELVAIAAFLAGYGVREPVTDAMLDAARARVATSRQARNERRAKNATDAKLATIRWDAGDARAGAAVYDKLGCKSCHGNPKAKKPAPLLTGVGARLNRTELGRWIIDPPPELMASFAAQVTDEELASLVAHLASL